MPTEIDNRREDSRTEIPGFMDAEISFNGPHGAAHKYVLIELSATGGSFNLPQRAPDLHTGAACEEGRIHVGDLEIHVNMQIRHVTRGDGRGYEVGVRLFPVSDEDRNELTALVSRLRTVP